MKKDKIAVVTSTPSLISIVSEEINKLKRIQDSVYLTKKMFSQYNIETETHMSKLISAYAEIMAREEIYNKAASDLGLATYPEFKVEGSPACDWKKDILLRIDIIQYEDKLNRLKELKKEAEELMDKEDRKALLFEKIRKEIL